MKYVKGVIAALLIFFTIPALPALADQAQPDSTPTVEINVYRNSIEAGDQLYLIFANIPYSSVPTALVTEAFTWRLIDTDGVTELGQTVGAVFQENGYGYNVFSLYFSAADAPTWNQNYTLTLSENPSVFNTPVDFNFTLDSGDFSAVTSQSAVQDSIALKIISIAKQLDTRWSLASTASLLKSQETGTVLSTDGEIVFRAAIFGLQAMAPGAFDIVVETITATDRTWATAYATNISTQYAGTFIKTAQTAGASMFNKGYDLTSIIIALLMIAGILIANIVLKFGAYAGAIDAVFLGIVLARLGMYELSFVALIAAISWIYFSGKLWGVFR